MNTVSFMTANFVARQLGYRMTGGWGQGDTAANAYFAPIETYPERFDALLREVRAMGFGAIDLWLAHLHWSWATDAHLEVAHDLLQRHALRVVSLAGGFGGTADEFARTCRIANAVGTDTLGGSTPLLAADRPKLVEALGAFGLRLAIENHPERDPDELLATIGDGADGRIGTARSVSSTSRRTATRRPSAWRRWRSCGGGWGVAPRRPPDTPGDGALRRRRHGRGDSGAMRADSGRWRASPGFRAKRGGWPSAAVAQPARGPATGSAAKPADGRLDAAPAKHP